MWPHRRWLFIVASHTLCKDRIHACHKNTPWFINHEICHNTVNLNSLEINHDHFLSMPSPNFRLSGGSLGYWTACNNFKRYCTLPYCETVPCSSTSDIQRSLELANHARRCVGHGKDLSHPHPPWTKSPPFCRTWEDIFKCIFMKEFPRAGLGFNQSQTCLWQEAS